MVERIAKVRSFPKRQYVRSKKLLSAYREIPCQNCGRDDGTVVAAHSNWAEHGKGRGIKASDDRCASLCSRCHSTLDQWFSMSGAEKKAMWLAAHEKTIATLVLMGLWPESVPLPNLNYE